LPGFGARGLSESGSAGKRQERARAAGDARKLRWPCPPMRQRHFCRRPPVRVART